MLISLTLERLKRAVCYLLLVLVSACGGASGSPGSSTAGNSVVVATIAPLTAVLAASPAVIVDASTWAASGLMGAVDIPDNFITANGIEPTTYGPGGSPGIAAESSDSPGAFRMFCTAGQLLRDDPIVSPGKPGTAHLHQFFGNTEANAGSNYKSLRTTGGTTCGSDQNSASNRSSYWFPAMLDGVGHVVKPDFINLYYKRHPISSPKCAQNKVDPQPIGDCQGLPNGMRFVFGYNMATHTGGPADLNSDEQYYIHFECWGTKNPGSGKFRSLAEAFTNCPIGNELVIFANAPNCWDGVNLDSANHRSHLIFGTQPWSDFWRGCPTDHPYVIPDIQLQIHFAVDGNFIAGKWHLSSDEMVPGAAPGSTFHFDYWEAWSPVTKATWEENCIDKHRSCSSGDLGNGTLIKGAGVPAGGWTTHLLVPVL